VSLGEANCRIEFVTFLKTDVSMGGDAYGGKLRKPPHFKGRLLDVGKAANFCNNFAPRGTLG
jgi:hypothetical protein